MKNCLELVKKEEQLSSFKELVLSWAEKHVERLPWRYFDDEPVQVQREILWRVVVGEVLLGRTPTERVLPVFYDLIELAPNPTSFLCVEDETLIAKLKPLGLQRKKLSTLKEIARILATNDLQDLEEKLKKVKGIGKNTLNAILLFGLCKNQPLMDGTIGRVVSRVLGIKWKAKKAVLDKCAWYVSSLLVYEDCKKTKLLFYGLLDVGRKYCKVKKTDCTHCPLLILCESGKAGIKKKAFIQ